MEGAELNWGKDSMMRTQLVKCWITLKEERHKRVDILLSHRLPSLPAIRTHTNHICAQAEISDAHGDASCAVALVCVYVCSTIVVPFHHLVRSVAAGRVSVKDFLSDSVQISLVSRYNDNPSAESLYIWFEIQLGFFIVNIIKLKVI